MTRISFMDNYFHSHTTNKIINEYNAQGEMEYACICLCVYAEKGICNECPHPPIEHKHRRIYMRTFIHPMSVCVCDCVQTVHLKRSQKIVLSFLSLVVFLLFLVYLFNLFMSKLHWKNTFDKYHTICPTCLTMPIFDRIGSEISFKLVRKKLIIISIKVIKFNWNFDEI